MPAKITFDKCIDCPFSEQHRIATPDSFELEFGLYCSEVEDGGGDLNQRTLDGLINKKVIATGNELDDAKVPEWCPHLVKE